MKRILSLCLVLFVGVGLFSCKSSPAADLGQSGSSVWRISGDGNDLYLGGSIHVLRNSDYPLPEAFDLAFSRSQILVLEADVEQLEDKNISQYLAENMLLPGDITLRSILDPDIYSLLNAVFKEYGVSLDLMDKFKPSLVLNILSILQIQKYGFRQEGVDSHFMEKARSERKNVKYLESIESQIDLLLTMGDGYENDYVLYSLQDMENTELELASLVDEWRNGGSSRMDESLIEMKEDWPEIYEAMVSKRNNAWIPQIEEFLSSGIVHFVIVGVAHLHGPDGLLRQLKDLGYNVERL